MGSFRICRSLREGCCSFTAYKRGFKQETFHHNKEVMKLLWFCTKVDRLFMYRTRARLYFVVYCFPQEGFGALPSGNCLHGYSGEKKEYMEPASDNTPKQRLIPPVSLDGSGRVTSPICIWCLKQIPPSRTHLFPECLGGGFFTHLSCVGCNNYLGHSVESKVLRNVFLTQGIEKLELATSREAFRHARIWDQETGLEMKIGTQGGVSPIPKPIGEADNKFVGTPEERASYFAKRAQRRNPEIDVTPLENFFKEGKTGLFSFDGYKYSTTEHPEAMAELRIEDLTRDPAPALVFKIVYEFLAMLNFLEHPIIGPILDSYIKRHDSESKAPFNIHDSISDFVVSNTDVCFRTCENLREIPFKRFHHAMLRVTPSGVLWCEVGLFTHIQSWFLLTKIGSHDSKILSLLDKAFVFPFKSSEIVIIPFPSVEKREYYDWVNVKLDFKVSELNRAGIRIP